MPVQAVTFDFHNTLASCDEWFELEVRTLVPRFLDWLDVATPVELPTDTHDLAQRTYRSLREEIIHHGEEVSAVDGVVHVLRELDLPVSRELVEAGVQTLMHNALAGSEPVSGVVEGVQALSAHGVKLAVISNAVYHPFLLWSLEKFGILDCFEIVVTSASAGYYKSRPELYQHVLDTLGTRPAETIHIGDSYRFDVLGARRVGMRTVWFQTDGLNEGAGDDADLTVTALDGIAERVMDHFGGDE